MKPTPSSGLNGVRLLPALVQAGVLQAWRGPVLVALGLLGAWEFRETGSSESTLPFTIFLSPFLAGTGVLAAARLGRLDLLAGRGASRGRILGTTLAGTLLPAAAIFALGLGLSRMGGLALLTAAGMFLFVFGVSFLGGLRGSTTVTGIGWIVAKVAFLLSSYGYMTISLRRSADAGGPPIAAPRLGLELAVLPEFSLDGPVPPALTLGFGLLGVACVVVAFVWFERADWPGKRTS